MVEDDVFILDTYDNIFVWIGNDARPEEKTQAMDTAVVCEMFIYTVIYSKNSNMYRKISTENYNIYLNYIMCQFLEYGHKVDLYIRDESQHTDICKTGHI